MSINVFIFDDNRLGIDMIDFEVITQVGELLLLRNFASAIPARLEADEFN